MDSTSGPKGRKEKILTNMVSRLQKIATKSKIVAKAAEKVSSYPLILSVEVKSLNGFLVLNMAPPPSDALWYVIVYSVPYTWHTVYIKVYMYVQYVTMCLHNYYYVQYIIYDALWYVIVYCTIHLHVCSNECTITLCISIFLFPH